MEEEDNSCARDEDLEEKPGDKGLEPSRLTGVRLSHGKEIDIEEQSDVQKDHKNPTEELRTECHTT
jgi:hypothetical protein